MQTGQSPLHQGGITEAVCVISETKLWLNFTCSKLRFHVKCDELVPMIKFEYALDSLSFAPFISFVHAGLSICITWFTLREWSFKVEPHHVFSIKVMEGGNRVFWFGCWPCAWFRRIFYAPSLLEMTEIGSLCSKQVCRILIIQAYCGKSTLTSYVHMMHGEEQLGDCP